MSGSHPGSTGPGLRRPANPITSSQVEVVASTATSVLGLVFGLQTIPPLLGQLPLMLTPLGLLMIVAVFGSLILAGLAAVFRTWTVPAFGAVAVLYLAALAAWEFVVPPIPVGDVPWIFYLCNVATGCAVVAARERWLLALGYTLVTPALLGWIRAQASGGSLSDLAASLDGFYCFLIGLVMLVIIVALRQAARAVDQAQGYALESYAAAVRHDATESERVRVDALVHDNVLITLLSAARARTPETMALATRMARNAIEHLDEAQTTFPTERVDVPVERLEGRLRFAVAQLSKPIDVEVSLGDDLEIPSTVVDAIAEAATQALVNSVNHADSPSHPAQRRLRLTVLRSAKLLVEIIDDGVGFDPELVPLERLGVRTSIIERMSTAGGRADIVSAPGRGTTVRLTWPADDGRAHESDEAQLPDPAVLDIVGEKGGDRS